MLNKAQLIKLCCTLAFLSMFPSALHANPRIWVNNTDKAEILENIDNYAWAKDLKKQLEERVVPWSSRHKRDPQFLLSRLPRTWGKAQNYTDADLTQKNSNMPYARSGNAPIPTFHRSDDYIPQTKDGKRYVYPGIEGMVPYNSNPYYGMELQIDKTDRKEFQPYLARFLRNIYTDVLILGVDSAVLYYLTGEEEYAQLTADILHAFVEPLALMNVVKGGRGGFFIADFLRDVRITAPMFPLMYDFVKPFLNKSNTRVYDAVEKKRERFNDTAAQTVFVKLAELVLNEGITQSNWAILEGNGILYNLIVINDAAERNRLFDKFFNENTLRHDSFTWSMNNFTPENLWPESLLYSFDVNDRILTMMNIIDRNKDIFDVDVFGTNRALLDGAFIYENLEYPTREPLRFGDATRDAFDLKKIYATALTIAKRKNYTQYAKRAEEGLAQEWKSAGGYSPEIVTERLIYQSPLQLLWGNNIDLNKAKPQQKEKTIHIAHAGIVLQRNYATDNIIDNGLMYYTGGAAYVHAQASGIDFEVYGAGSIMGQDFGAGLYGTDLHNHYAFNPASHNTVIVNNKAQRGEGGWDFIMDDTQLLAAEPGSFKESLSQNFSFSCQALNDTINDADHQRCIAMVRTSNTSGYYVDFSRAKSKGQDRHSDYLFHNLGDKTTIKELNGQNISLRDTPNRYKNDLGDEHKSPGWYFFEKTKTTAQTNKTVHVQFQLEAIDRAMNAYIVGGDGDREVSLAEGPATPGAKNGYHRKPTQVMTIRRQGEAWKRPYVVVYEPQVGNNRVITDVKILKNNNEVVGVEVVSVEGGLQTRDVILAQDNANKTYNRDGIKFTGRFAIVREATTNGAKATELYIGDGKSLEYAGIALNTGNKTSGYRKVGDDIAGTVVPKNLADKGFTFAAKEREDIQHSRPFDVAYGAEGNFIYSQNVRGAKRCENNLCSKDPAPSTPKYCYIRESKTPYNTRYASIPGTLEAEHYDYGGNGVSYFDSSPELNKGGESAKFRADEGVDIREGNGGYVIGWVGDGEWAEYSVYAHKTGLFNANIVAAATKEGEVSIMRNGDIIADKVAIGITGSNDKYQNNTIQIQLNKGVHRLRVLFNKGDFDFDKIEFTEVAQ